MPERLTDETIQDIINNGLKVSCGTDDQRVVFGSVQSIALEVQALRARAGMVQGLEQAANREEYAKEYNARLADEWRRRADAEQARADRLAAASRIVAVAATTLEQEEVRLFGLRPMRAGRFGKEVQALIAAAEALRAALAPPVPDQTGETS